MYWGIRLFTLLVQWLLTRPRIVGRARIPRAGGILVVSNHAGTADPVILMAVMPRPLAFMTKEELFRPVLARTILRLWRGAFPVRRGEVDVGALRDALELIREGYPVVLFPEGTRSPDGLRRGQPGVGYLAVRARCPVLPVAIIGSEAMQDIWCLRHRPRFEVRIGEPFQLPEGVRDPAEAVDAIMARVADLLPHERRGVYRQRAQVVGDG